ncbi:MAG: 4-(cytidine 5'-diphospho)-2-C-methyl-D-erythritol kinase [Phycisphaerales bacterium]
MTKNILPQFENLKDGLLTRAPAKINLSLLIADKRPDGYHNLETVMAKINFYDELFFELNDSKKLELVCKGNWSPEGKDNLVFKAAEMFYKAAGENPSVRITLTKKIPAGSGLGSASSDAATTVLALNKLHNGILAQSTMYEICAQLGSDVSFFLNGPLALCSGRGEKVVKIDKKLDFSAILMLPDVNISTKRVYESYKIDMEMFRAESEKIHKIIKEDKIELLQNCCVNMLAKTCFLLDNKLALLQVNTQEKTRVPVYLSGSGSALFVLLDNSNYQNIDFIRREINSLGCNCIIVSSNEW